MNMNQGYISVRPAKILFITAAVLILVAHPFAAAQQKTGVETPAPASTSQERVQVFTEEVRLPVFVTDEKGRFDPSLQGDDLLVLEDDVSQRVMSIRRVPSNILLLLDTTGGMNPAMKTNTTRDVALRLVRNIKEGDAMAAIQFGDRVEVIQTWTANVHTVAHSLKTKLSSGRRSRLSEALSAAATQLSERPAGTRHLVLITDGADSSNDQTKLVEAIKRLLTVQATVHIISYAGVGTQLLRDLTRVKRINAERRRNAQDIYDEMFGPETVDPTSEEAKEKKRTFTVIRLTIELDREMRRRREEYRQAIEKSGRWLSVLAEETGGLMLMPVSTKEIINQGEAVARRIGAQYIISYTPKRPLALASRGEYRRVNVISRRVGLYVKARRGYLLSVEE
jgi:VWFA-related protein